MSAMDPQMNGNGGPPTLPNGTLLEDPAMSVQAMLRGLRVSAENISGESSSEEAKDWADTVLKLAQAIVVLDPQVSQGGTPLAHDVAMKTIDHETQKAVATIHGQTQVQVEQVRGENQLRQAREVAAAPTPSKKLAVRRDGAGRMTGIDQEG
jgi:hypothetical protein